LKLLSIQHASKTLNGKPILNNVNLSVRKGEIMALVGPSGSGKSTLLRCINRLIEIDSGSILLNNINIRDIPPRDLRRRVVLVHQESVMFPGTIFSNVSYGPSLMGTIDKNHITNCVKQAGLPAAFLEKNAEQLSGGEKKRVALARALALKPAMLLLDEPTSGVDPKNVKTVEHSIISFTETLGLTVIWVTHDVEQAKRVSHRIANLKDGVVREIQDTGTFHWEGAY
jgi:putative ABC transport system ATP-binding protein